MKESDIITIAAAILASGTWPENDHVHVARAENLRSEAVRLERIRQSEADKKKAVREAKEAAERDASFDAFCATPEGRIVTACATYGGFDLANGTRLTVHSLRSSKTIHVSMQDSASYLLLITTHPDDHTKTVVADGVGDIVSALADAVDEHIQTMKPPTRTGKLLAEEAAKKAEIAATIRAALTA